MQSQNKNFKKVIQTIRENKTFLLSTHISPDPDGMCSQLAMAAFLRTLGKKVTIVNNEKPAKKYDFIPGIRQIRPYRAKTAIAHYDVTIIFDCGEFDRIGKVTKLIRKDNTIINIDHHITNTQFGDINLVIPEASSTTEVVYQLFKEDGAALTKNVAMNIYIGIMTDTGSFRYENTTAKVHKIVGELMEHNFSAYDCYRNVYWASSLNDVKHFIKTMNNFSIILNGKVAYVEVKKTTLSRFSGSFDLNDAIFNLLRSIKSIDVIAIFSENSSDKTRVNFRSVKRVDVAKLARSFNGGGHRRASGCLIEKNMKKSKKDVLRQIKKVI